MNWKQKLSSRKLWAAIVGVIVGLAAAFGIGEKTTRRSLVWSRLRHPLWHTFSGKPKLTQRHPCRLSSLPLTRRKTR